MGTEKPTRGPLPETPELQEPFRQAYEKWQKASKKAEKPVPPHEDTNTTAADDDRDERLHDAGAYHREK